MTNYGLLLFQDAEELDFVGPWEVFTASAMLLEAQRREPVDRAFTVGTTADPVACAKGLRVVADYTLSDSPNIDVLLIPGGIGTRRAVKDRSLLSWLATVGGSATWATSVCTGSLLLVESGLAKGRRVATHWSFEDELDEFDCTVVRDMRWVRDGNCVSSQGVSAGIDMALWLVGQIHGAGHARATQHYIQYAPAPPYQAEV
jgi:transcriptional regulator GlxA family with amidase domain